MKKRKKQIIGSIVLLIVFVAITVTANMAGNGNDGRKAKYIFLFIGDGMGASHVAAAESFLSFQKGLKGGEQLSFTRFPVLGMATTYSADRNVTCSSASGTAIACGAKTDNGILGIDPHGDTLKSIAYVLKEQGYKIGIMSSVPMNHATPASFYAHNTDRYDYYGVTREMSRSGFDLFGGSGFVDFCGKDGSLEASSTLLERAGYTVCYSAEEADAAAGNTQKMVLCQPGGKGKSVSDYLVSPADGKDMSPGTMIDKCLKFFGERKPFFIMYEGGEIDWAAHENKTMPMIEDILRFNEAVERAVSFYKAHPDETLIIVTADHETGGITLGATKTWDEVNLGWGLLDSIWTAAGHVNDLDYDMNRAMNGSAFIGWTTRGHTGGPVPVYAIGKGAERFGGRYDNTDIKGKILGE